MDRIRVAAGLGMGPWGGVIDIPEFRPGVRSFTNAQFRDCEGQNQGAPDLHQPAAAALFRHISKKLNRSRNGRTERGGEGPRKVQQAVRGQGLGVK